MATQLPDDATFAVELRRWRTLRGLSKAALAKRLSIDPSYISHLEAARERGSPQLGRRLDVELCAGGELWDAWQDAEPSEPVPFADAASATGGLFVLDDTASLTFDGDVYYVSMRRRISNGGVEPVTRYLIRIAVDKYPGEAARSNSLYRANPLTWDELGLTAECGSEPMTWTVADDRDAFKEVWLEFSNRSSQFPLYPGQEAEITYSYTVRADKWGTWFQRAVRLPTRRLSVELTLPTALEPAVWGTETSLSSQQTPLRTAIARTDKGQETVFSWSTVDPPLHAHYRLCWHYRQKEIEVPQMPDGIHTASELMAGAGVAQEGDPILVGQAVPFDLPHQAEEARQVVHELLNAVDRIRELHVFGKGMGVAAPQIGISRAAAVVIPPGQGSEPVVLLNARIAESSGEIDEQYEGCLSFFDVRGLVPRPLQIVVEHTDLDGRRHLSSFEQGMARLVAHEVDHLHGVLYRTRMRPGTDPIPVREYPGQGEAWQYR